MVSFHLSQFACVLPSVKMLDISVADWVQNRA
jgi:hypothetical protein